MAMRIETTKKSQFGRPITETIISFDTYSEFIAKCHTFKGKTINAGFREGYGGKAWQGTDTYDAAYKLASEGWKEGRELLKLELDQLNIETYVRKPEQYFDVTGDFGFDMGLVMAGEPECVLMERDSQDFQSKLNGPVFRMLVNTAISAGVEVDVIMRRGAAICALTDILENLNVRVEIDVICAAHFGSHVRTHRFPLKRADESLQIDQIAFCIAHPAIERRFNFIALELFDGWESHSYGAPMDVPADDYDIYIPSLTWGSADWQNIASVNNWIKQSLGALGFRIEGLEE
jgi:hypothetical protein